MVPATLIATAFPGAASHAGMKCTCGKVINDCRPYLAEQFRDHIGITDVVPMQNKFPLTHLSQTMLTAGQIIQNVNFAIPLRDKLAHQFSAYKSDPAGYQTGWFFIGQLFRRELDARPLRRRR